MSDPTQADRRTLIRSVFQPSPLDEVAKAVSVATEHERQVYVERFGDKWRWSLVHAGGPYPLLRITARFLQVDHTTIIIGHRTIDGGLSVLTEDPNDIEEPDGWAVLTFRGKASKGAVAKLMVEAVPDPQRSTGDVIAIEPDHDPHSGRVATWVPGAYYDPDPELPHDDPLSLADEDRDALAKRMGWTREYVNHLIAKAGSEPDPPDPHDDESEDQR